MTVDYRFIKFVLNGLIATAVNFFTLVFCVDYLMIKQIFFSTFIATAIGISASYLGNRYFVFTEYLTAKNTLIKFICFYSLIAFIQSLLMYLWADLFQLNYKIGFIFITGLQVLLSYLINKLIVFKE